MKSPGPKQPVKYDHATIEKKWQKQWEKTGAFAAKDSTAKKFYALIEFPYPSGDGLHVGHIRSNTAMDVIARKRRREGYNVLYPIGWDAFGLPTENYAIKTGIQPAVVTKQNSDNFRRQLTSIGFSFDWSREINTTDPRYYKWTQWIFLQFLKAGLAYKKKMTINWCPKDLIGLANEEVIDGKCERCGTPVEKREKEQWMLAITKYADKLLADLDAVEYVDPATGAPYVMPQLVDKVNPHEPGKPVIRREVAHAIVYDPKAKKYLIIRNKKFGWDTVVIGGIEDGESPVDTARREVREETGYTDLEFKRILGGPTEAHYYTKHKGENRIAIAQAVYFELKSPARTEINDDGDKDKTNEILWIDAADFVPGKMVNSELPIWLERLADPRKGQAEARPLLDWSEHIKESQRNWIGKSEGMMFTAPVKDTTLSIQTFNAHFEPFTADTFVVIAPDHPFLKELVKGTKEEKEVLEYAAKIVAQKISAGREETKDFEGIFTGRYIVDPVGNGDLPIWVASYALADYGTGVVKCSAHDERDFAFAKKYNIRLKPVLFPEDPAAKEKVEKLEMCFTDIEYGVLAEPKEFAGKNARAERQNIVKYLEKNKLAEKKTTYKLRDWVFSRQRYWGEPIPVIHCETCGIVPVPEKDLPVELPAVKNYQPTQTGESPLAAISKWVNVKCPKCRGKARRETDTMPNWAGSSWYYLRYADPKNTKMFASPELLKYWTPVDWYNGGMEHTTLHLLYSRFWHKFLFDQGLVPTREPYHKRTSHGLILAKGGEKMSKSKGNVVNPDGIVKAVGADSLRLYEMFMGPFDQAIAWDENGIVGCRRFLEKVWKIGQKIVEKTTGDKKEIRENSEGDLKIKSLINKTIKKVSDDIESMHFNTAVSALMIAVNEIEKAADTMSASALRNVYLSVLGLLAPFAPHMTEELWHELGSKTSIHGEAWPMYDPAKIADEKVTIAVQINGKTRATFQMDAALAQNMPENKAREMAVALDGIKDKVYDKDIKKVIYVKGRLVNIVIN